MKGLEIPHQNIIIIEISINTSIEMKIVLIKLHLVNQTINAHHCCRITSAFSCQGTCGNAALYVLHNKLHTNFLVPCRLQESKKASYEPVHPNATINDNVLDKAPSMSSLLDILYICWGSLISVSDRHWWSQPYLKMIKRIAQTFVFLAFLWVVWDMCEANVSCMV